MISTTNKVAGYYKIEVKRPDGSTRLFFEFPNLVTNNGLDRICTGGIYFPNCYVGTGSTPPVETNTQLENLVAYKTGHSSMSGPASAPSLPNPYRWFRKTFVFPQGAYVGNVSEVGVGWGATTLFSRSLIKDENGNPITITLTSIDVLTITYEFRFYLNDVVSEYTLDINGVTTNIKVIPRIVLPGHTDATRTLQYFFPEYPLRPCVYYTNHYWETNVAYSTSLPTDAYIHNGHDPQTYDNDNRDGVNVRVTDSYIPGSFYTRHKLTFVETNANLSPYINNLNLVTSDPNLYDYNLGQFTTITFDPPLVKNNTQRLEFYVRLYVGRYTPP